MKMRSFYSFSGCILLLTVVHTCTLWLNRIIHWVREYAVVLMTLLGHYHESAISEASSRTASKKSKEILHMKLPWPKAPSV